MLLKTCETESAESFVRHDSEHTVSSALANCRSRKGKLRVAFYSHDAMGMGHIRRNLLIASSLVRACPEVEALLIAGTREAAYFATQAGMDCITLPALTKNSSGQYSARNFEWNLTDTTRLRSRIILATMEEFAPDVLVVDKLPRGIGNELHASLEYLRTRETRCVLGLRDVLDEPAVVAREWSRDGNETAIERYFHELWIYGDREIYDCVQEYSFSQVVASRAWFTGYLNQAVRYNTSSTTPQANSDCPTALCVVGGGQDGFELAAAFVQSRLPAGWRGVVVTGPFMPAAGRSQLRQLAERNGQFEIIDRLVETDEYLQCAERVIAMGGYNTVTSILSFGKPALIVPRVHPRQEQFLRAERLAQRGCISTLTPQQLSAEALTQWLNAPVVPTPRPGCVDLCGLERIQHRVGQYSSTLAGV